MNIWLWLLLGVAAGGALVWFWLNRKKAEAPEAERTESLLLIQNQISALTQLIDGKLSESSKTMFESVKSQFGESQKLIDRFIKELIQVAEKVTRVEETGKQIVGFADQLQDLQDILKNPKQRGILGEYYLETLLKNVLGAGNYKMQYQFRDGLIVDAAVFVKDKIIPIDSKFSLENYNRLAEEKNPAERERLEKLFVNDLKLRIQETARYIRPEEGTMEFAFMFIPHEAIYYDLLVNKIGAVGGDTESLIQRAAGKYHVIIVSPTSFLAYLQTVLQGLKAMQIEETAKEIVKRVGELGRHLKNYEGYHGKLGNALGVIVSHYNKSGQELKKIDKDVLRISGEAPGLKPTLVEAPGREEIE